MLCVFHSLRPFSLFLIFSLALCAFVLCCCSQFALSNRFLSESTCDKCIWEMFDIYFYLTVVSGVAYKMPYVYILQHFESIHFHSALTERFACTAMANENVNVIFNICICLCYINTLTIGLIYQEEEKKRSERHTERKIFQQIFKMLLTLRSFGI